MSRARIAVLGATIALLGAACADRASPRAGSSADPVPAATLEVRCDGETTEVLTPVIQAQSEGVHVLVHNVGSKRVLVQWEGGGDGADPGDERFVFAMAPGDARFRCQADDADPGAPGGWASFTLIEPDGWVSPELDCGPAGTFVMISDFVEGATGVADPLAHAVTKAHGLPVVQAGYAPDGQRTFVALDGGAAVQSFEYHSDGHGGWLLGTRSGCSD